MKKPLITPNALTTLRFFFAGFAVYFLCIPTLSMRIASAFVFLAAVITDFIDGQIARKYNMVSTFGKIADPMADKVLFMGLYIASIYLDLISPVWIIPIIIREVVVTILRLMFLRKGIVVAAESLGKIKVGFQVASIIALWLVLLVRDHVTQLPLIPFELFSLIAILGAVFLTVYSGFTFVLANSRSITQVGVTRCISTFFYSGLGPKAPGTWGSLMGIVFFAALMPSMTSHIAWLLAITAIGVWSSREMAEVRKNSDPQEVVIDEVAGIFVTMLFVPINWITLIAAFLLFRLFDITKPWPIKKLEKYPNGWGIMLDDLMAGVYANIVLQVVIRIL